MNARQTHSMKQEEHEKHLVDLDLSLRIGSWKNLFEEYQYKTIIAEALNECVSQRREDFRVQIIGYLITSGRICLVMKMRKEHRERMLSFFYAKVREEIRRHLKLREENSYFEKEQIKKDTSEASDRHVPLFEKQPEPNHYLVDLITGHEVDLRYYDPYLERLKKYLHRENFCSVADYAGAKGPVIVHTQKT